MIDKPGRSRRYHATRSGLRAMCALFVLRDKVIQPLLADNCRLAPAVRPFVKPPSMSITKSSNTRCATSFTTWALRPSDKTFWMSS